MLSGIFEAAIAEKEHEPRITKAVTLFRNILETSRSKHLAQARSVALYCTISFVQETLWCMGGAMGIGNFTRFGEPIGAHSFGNSLRDVSTEIRIGGSVPIRDVFARHASQ